MSTNKNYEKLYKDALERAKKIDIDEAYASQGTIAKTIFPELSESEDERIRKSILHKMEACKKQSNFFSEEEISWLEKQKENIEKEYVFRPLAGTDINTAVLQAIRRANEGDRLVLAFNGAYIPVRKGVDANKIVDIYDAFVEKKKEQKPELPLMGGDTDTYFDDLRITTKPLTSREWFDEGIKFAQRLQKEPKPVDDKAFEEWIDNWYQSSEVGGYIIMSEAEFKNWNRGIRNMYQQKPTEWSQEDEEMRNLIVAIFEVNHPDGFFKANELGTTDMHGVHTEEIISWLKSLPLNLKKKNEDVAKLCSNEWSDTNELVFQDICKHLKEGGYGGWVVLLRALRNGEFQPKQAWSEEDKKNLKQCVEIVGGWEIDYDNPNRRYSNWLKSLPERFNLQPKKEWTEEDEKQIAQIERICKNAGCSKILQEKIHNWFDSLCFKVVKWDTDMMNIRNSIREVLYKEKKCPNAWFTYLEHCGPQTKYAYWKPSEEQMEAIKHAYNSFPNDCPTKSNLMFLYRDLKKLM